MIAKGSFSAAFHDEAVSLLERVCTIPAPSHDEGRRADFIMSWLEEKGVEGAYMDEAKNVVIPYCDDGVCGLDVFAAHTDVVFPDTDPLPMRIEGDTLHCPGSGDDTANFVALMLYAAYIITNRVPVKRGILFVCNSCEEGLGNLYGTRTLFERYGDRIATFTSFDSVLGRGIVNTAVGSERYVIRVATEGGHSFADFGARNAIAVLSSVIVKLYGQSTDSKMTTYNVGTISGGTSVNSIAQSAECLYEFRAVDERSLGRMRSGFEGIISSFRAKNIDITYECIGQRPCGADVDTSGLEDVAQKIISSYGYPVMRGVSSTDCNIPLSMGIPAICFGLIKATGTHTRQEKVDLASYRDGLDIGYDYICSLCLEA